MPLFKKRDRDPLAGVDLGLDPADTVLAVCTDTSTGERLVASKHQLSIVAAPGEDAAALEQATVRLQRPWHLVDAGSYDNDADVLTVSWVDREPDLALHVGFHRPFLTAFRERVQASVIVADEIEMGQRRSIRVVVRKDLARDKLLDQVILGPGVRLAQPGVRDKVAAARLALREQVGLA